MLIMISMFGNLGNSGLIKYSTPAHLEGNVQSSCLYNLWFIIWYLVPLSLTLSMSFLEIPFLNGLRSDERTCRWQEQFT